MKDDYPIKILVRSAVFERNSWTDWNRAADPDSYFANAQIRMHKSLQSKFLLNIYWTMWQCVKVSISLILFSTNFVRADPEPYFVLDTSPWFLLCKGQSRIFLHKDRDPGQIQADPQHWLKLSMEINNISYITLIQKWAEGSKEARK